MAKRRRLTPVSLPDDLETKSASPGITPPIAQVAGASAAFSAVQDLEDKMRAEGRLVVNLPLEAIQETHLMRDRMGVEASEMEALKASLAAHGQRNPIEVEELGEGRFGLISGWRRLTALKALHMETGEERFARVAVLLRTPADRADAYIAMVEENEIRADLSHYERARVAARAAGQGAFESPEAAVDMLFAAGSRARRSKIRSFLRVYRALDDVLVFPTALSERLGLRLAEGLKSGQHDMLHTGLSASPAQTPEEEAETLNRLLAGPKAQKPETSNRSATILEHPRLKVMSKKAEKGFQISFTGPDAGPELEQKLTKLLLENYEKP